MVERRLDSSPAVADDGTTDGEMADLIRAHDWAATPLGAIGMWSPALSTAVAICLDSGFATFVWWGSALTQLYNDATLAIVRAKHPGSLGQPAREAWAEAWPVVGQLIDHVLTTGEAVRGEDFAVVLERGGPPEEAFFTFSYSALRDTDGHIAGVWITAIETTTQVRSLAALRASEARQAFVLELSDRLRSLVDAAAIQDEAARALGEHLGASRVGYTEDTGDGATVAVTRQYFNGVPAITGHFRYEDFGADVVQSFLLGRALVRHDVLREPTLSDAEKAAYTALQIGSAITVPLLKAGRLRAAFFVHHREARPYTPDDVTLVEAVAERTWDATERTRAETALHESEARLRLALDVAELGTWNWNLTTGAGDIDARGAAIVALSAGSLADVVAAQRARVHPDDLTRLGAELTAGIARGGDFSLAYRAVEPTVGVRHVVSRARVIMDAAGQPSWLVGTNRDVTSEHVAAAERERLLQAERAAREEAEAAVRARDTFLSIAAHELKTPVSGLKGATQLLARRMEAGNLDPDRLARTVAVLRESADRLARLTDELLDVARIDAGQLALTPRPADLAALARTVIGRLTDQPSMAHHVMLDVPEEPPIVWADSDRIDQVLTNLLDNAVKYSPAGGTVLVTIRAADGRVVVAVADAGIGLPAGSAGAIFAPFGRAPNAAASHLPGMGLGLFICRTIVERHGGAIEATSAGEGQGTTVTFWLPIAPAERDEA